MKSYWKWSSGKEKCSAWQSHLIIHHHRILLDVGHHGVYLLLILWFKGENQKFLIETLAPKLILAVLWNSSNYHVILHSTAILIIRRPQTGWPVHRMNWVIKIRIWRSSSRSGISRHLENGKEKLVGGQECKQKNKQAVIINSLEGSKK